MWAASCLASCCAACACDACRTVVSGISRRSARIAYCGLFALSLIVSWILREVAAPLMEKLPCKPLNTAPVGLPSIQVYLFVFCEDIKIAAARMNIELMARAFLLNVEINSIGS